MSGLSSGVVVHRSGKKLRHFKITPQEQAREVFAVPGSSFDICCSGTNALIKNGAILVEKAEDVIEELESNKCNPLAFKDKDAKFHTTKSSATKNEHPFRR
ncbi:MAG: hypothetical protein MRQ11_00745 [Candidatus Midichloria mitochondrii]|nr:hypothetical protein [Candidatus Midichloria mitochondrii]MDJ1287766.1 hypothetical protein [Candidatus Midichloria mitochondrii]MDJ1298734.1 hypothetical protein [Candidatus Midichloria mitochondrii]MDJ1312616.1 hypothetical protein [Candidatus Midichloria mitochondrii]MDJ1583224.1 hypothetical protein [Candidatus Midichloria mitochondrii]